MDLYNRLKLFLSLDSLILFRGDLMVNFKGRINVILGMFLIVTAVMLQLSSITLAAPGSDGVEVSVTAGYEDIVKIGTEVPFHITLVNKGKGFSGEAQVIIDTGYLTKTVFAMNFELPQGSTKKLTLNVPINTANRRAKVKIESNGHTIKDIEYSFYKVLSPTTSTIGILGDAYDQLRVLSGLKIKQIQQEENDLRKYGISYEDVVGSTIESPAEVIQLNEDNFPEDAKSFATFNYIVIADYDTSLLSDKQMQALEDWINEGKVLILAGGTNAKKVYSGLSDSLKPFEILGNKKESITEVLEKVTESSAPDTLIDISTGNIGEGNILMGDEITPLAVSYNKGKGKILFIAFDPTMSPISTWENSEVMWKRLMDANIQTTYNYYSNRDYYRYSSVVHQVPEDQTPPYKTLLRIILVYIIIVGPVLYIILKRKDKRDYSWVIIPVLSLLCLGVIYVSGFRTRYISAVMNNFSIINLDSDSKTAAIDTYSSVFNNRAGSMTIEYPKDYSINVIRENESNYMRNYHFTDEDYNNAQIKSKIYANDSVKHEIYNVGLWEPCILTTTQTQNYEGRLIKTVSLAGNDFYIELKNDTGFAVEDAFLVVGGNYIDVGNILPDEERKISISLKDNSNVFKNYRQLLDSKYYNQTFNYKDFPKDWQEQQRKRLAFENFNRLMDYRFENNNYNSTKVYLVALNFENVDYGVKVNGKNTKAYNTNVVVTSEDLFVEKGKRIDIPKGIINPVFTGGESVDFYDSYGETITIYADTEVFYRFEIPKDIIVDEFLLDWSLSIPEYMKEKYYQDGVAQEQLDGAKYELFIYNNIISDWETVDDVFEVKDITENYINEENIIHVKIGVDIDETVGRSEYIWKPQISISGVIKSAIN